METLIKSTAELQKYVKVNKSMNFEMFRSFLIDAQDKYILPYIGQETIDQIKDSESDKLREYLCRALGPFAMASATDEFSIGFGESGHTVARSEDLAPASDAKIEKAKESLYKRGWSNMDTALKYLEKQKQTYPDWANNRQISTKLFENASEFQEKGLVDIDNSPLTFHHMRMLILRIESSETFKLLPEEMQDNFNKSEVAKITDAMQAYTGSRVAALHTSQSTKMQRSKPANGVEFKPTIRPLYDDIEQTGNYFAEQAIYWRGVLDEALVENDKKSEDENKMKFNGPDRKLFVATASRL